MVKSRKVRWAGHVVRMERKKNAYKIWGESQKERELGGMDCINPKALVNTVMKIQVP
jgi:hypothetical protein